MTTAEITSDLTADLPAGYQSSDPSGPYTAQDRADDRAEDRGANPHHARRWLILVVLALAQLMVVLDSTVVNIALPSAQRALSFSDGDRQWIVTAYSLAFGSLLLLGGRLADLFGRKRVFLIGLAGFATASAAGGAATGFATLVVARAVQGGFGALLAPAALALLATTFTDPKERNKAYGIYGAIAGGGAALGLLLGGVLTEYLSWRWCLYVNIAFAVPAILGGIALLVHRNAEDRPKLDLPGTLTVSAGLFSLVYGFSHAETAGWSSTVTLGFLLAAVVLLGAFVAIQQRVPHPLLPLRVVLDRNRGGAFLAMLLSAAGMFGVFLFLTYYLQQSLGYSAVETGLAFLPMCFVLVLVASVVTTILSTRVGPRVTIPAGLLIGAFSMYLLTRIGAQSDYLGTLLPPLLLLGVALGLVFATAMSLATLGVDSQDAGVAGAAVNTMQQVGGSIGTALLNTLAATAAANYLIGKTANPATIAQSALHSYTTAFWWSAAIFLIGAVLCAIVLRPGVPAVDEQAAPALMH
ncbi:MAG: transporter [Frankiales bacterium]|nr:transporter [Frankiales bacterium]